VKQAIFMLMLMQITPESVPGTNQY